METETDNTKNVVIMVFIILILFILSRNYEQAGSRTVPKTSTSSILVNYPVYNIMFVAERTINPLASSFAYGFAYGFTYSLLLTTNK